jgi:hypothetical protein
MVESKCTCGLFGEVYCEVHRYEREHRAAMMRPNLARETLAKHWTTLLPPYPNGAPYVMPGARCEFGAFPMVTFRPTQIAISTNSRAKLSVEFRLRNQCWEFGAIDSWNRRRGQIITSFIRELVGLDSVNPADKIAIAVTNYGKFSSKVFAQVDGVMCMNL